MTQKTKHTTTPWVVQDIDDEKGSEEYGSAFIVGDNLGGLVGAALPFSTELDSGDFSRVEANAAHIVKCVNMHDELEKALKNWIELIESGDAGFWDPEKDNHVISMRKVLAKARGET